MEASVATPGQGAPAAGAQPPAGGQGTPQGQSTAAGKGDGGQFNWGMFPDVPAEQRELLEPHLRNVQGHVTRIEQQYAPYQGLLSAVQPDQVENLIGFLNGYSTDASSTILGLLQQGIQDGSIQPDAVTGLLPQQAALPGQQAQPGEEIPAWAQQMQQQLQQYEQRFGQFDQAQQQQAEAEEAAEQERILGEAKTNIRAQLDQAGIGEELVDDQMLVASIIASDGDEQMAANMLTQMRQNFLTAFTNGKATPGAPVVHGDLPRPQGGPQRRGDGFDDARTGAKQFLEQQARAAAGG